MILIDSNIIIYAAQPRHPKLRLFIQENAPAVSAVSYVEVLGYPQLTEEALHHFEAFFAAATILPISDAVLDHAVRLRRHRKISLGDALTAGTALAHSLTLATCNTKDFDWIEGLALLNPLES